ncbi:4Fe-4S binding protein [Romboutsia sp. 1001713B170207_170306_H8]|uniref:4Fe-4S binding protein n=1 Tax=Romboutsia sp. 1001713B170207_170306_H8 TaxID=2787112 RepID=UPI003FA743C8
MSYNRNKCTHCTLCEKTCPVNAITVSRKDKNWSIDHNICVRCTHCVAKCPKKLFF